MMQQQLLLIILGVIIVGAAIALGFVMMSDQSTSTNRDLVSSDLLSMGAKVQSYYRRPISHGGGEHSFDGLTVSKVMRDTVTANGSFSVVGAVTAQGPVRIRGLGKTLGLDRVSPVRVEMLVYPDTIALDPGSIN